MKVLFFQYIVTGSSYHATELELIEGHLEKGDEVEIVTCFSQKYGCDLNPQRQFLHCQSCKIQTRRGNRLLSRKVRQRDYMDLLPEDRGAEIGRIVAGLPVDSEALRKVWVENYDFGMGIMSSLISISRDAHLDLEKHRSRVEGIAKPALAIYFALDALLSQEQFGHAYVFNGRFAGWRAARRAFEKHGVPYTTHEGGHTAMHYALFENATPHDIAYCEKRIAELWERNPSSREKDAEEFYQWRAFGTYSDTENQNKINFVSKQSKGKLPDGWSQDRENVVVYCSSEDEFAAIGEEWKNPLYKSQLEGLQEISAAARELPDTIDIYLRVHPNLSGVHNKFSRALSGLAHDRFRIILADSDVCSYSMLFNCARAVSFGSTIGMEATYWGKPSILLGNCFYRNLGGTYNPATHDEAMALFATPLDPLPREPALRFANYLMNFGFPYKIADASRGCRDTWFRGVHLNGNVLHRSLLKLKLKTLGTRFQQLIKDAPKSPEAEA